MSNIKKGSRGQKGAKTCQVLFEWLLAAAKHIFLSFKEMIFLLS